MSEIETTTPSDPSGERRDLSEVILRNSLVLTIGQGATRLLNILFVIYAVRFLGEQGWGSYAIVVSFVSLFSVFFELGLSQYVERGIARDPRAAQSLFWNLVVLRLILAGLGIVVLTTAAFVVGYDQAIVVGVFLQTSTFVLAAFLTPLTTVLTANERFDLATVAQLANQVVTIGLGLVLLSLDFGFLALLYTGFVGMPLQILLASWAIRRHGLGPLRGRIRPASWPPMLRASLPFGVTSLALTSSFNADSVMLGLFHGAGVVGLYNAAYRLVFNLTALAGGFLGSMTPSLAREQVTNAGRVASWTRASTRLLLLFALPTAVGGSLLASRIIEALYGRAFAEAGPVFAVLAWTVPFHLFNAFAGNVTAAVGLERPAARVFLASALLNIGLNLVFIPRYGLMAAAVVTVLTDGLAALRFISLLHQRLDLPGFWRQLGRTAAAAAGMGGVIYLAFPLPLPAVVLLGVLAYGLLAALLGLIDRSMLRAAGRLLAVARPGAG